MKKLGKKNKIGKYQTAWGPLGLNVGPIALSTGVTLPEIASGIGTGVGLTASAPALSLALPFALAAGSVGTGIYERRHGLYPHQTSPYTTTSVYTPELSDATYVTIPKGIDIGDYTYDATYNPLKWLGKLGRWAVNSVKSGFGSDATPPEDKDKDKKEEKPEEEKPGKEKESKTPEKTDAGQEVENALLKERINLLESRLKELSKTSKSSTWGKIGKGTAWTLGGGLGLWGTGSLLTRGSRGVGFAMQPGGTFGEGFKYTGNGMIGGVLRNLTKSKYEEYRKEHPIEDKSEENKEDDKNENTFRGTTTTGTGRPRLKLE